MTAYVIFVRDAVTDQAEMGEYTRLARLARGDHKIKPLVFYGRAEALEGPPVDGVVVLEFDDMQAAHAWYDSSVYQEAKSHRLRGASYRVVLAEGVKEST